MARATRIDRGVIYPADKFTELLTGNLYPAAGGASTLALNNTANQTFAPEAAPWAYLKLTGTLTAARTIILTRDEASPRVFTVENATSGGYAVTVKVTSGGTGVTVTNGSRGWLVTTNGTDVTDITPAGGGGGAVDSVFGRTGAVVAATDDYTWAQINKTTSSLADIATRSASDLSSGTLPDGRFPATLPAASGVNLTALNASNLASGTVASARLPPNVVYETGAQDLADKNLVSPSVEGAIAFEDGVRQTFNPNGTTPGLNVGSHAADPSAPQDGDLWYESTNKLLRARINGSTVSLGAGGGGGADTALSNLASVAVNTSLLPGTDNSIDLGSSAKKWRRGYFGSGAAPTPSVQIGEDTGLFLVSSGTLGFAFQGARYWQGNYQMLNIERDDGKIRIGAGGGNDVDYTADNAGSAKISPSSGKGLILTTGYLELTEMTAPSAPGANGGRLYLEDNGSGKTRLVVGFNTGAAQVIATEP
jgi:hypothetical protein